MKIKLNENYFIRIAPRKLYKYILCTDINGSEEDLDGFIKLDDCVDTCVQYVMDEKFYDEISLSEYIREADRIKEELFQGVVEYGS